MAAVGPDHNPHDEEWRQSRLWTRAIQLPDEDRTLQLCPRHQAMGLQSKNFFHQPVETDLPPDIYLGKLSEAIERSDYCNFCCLITQFGGDTTEADQMDLIGCWIPDGVLDGPRATRSLRLRIVPADPAHERYFSPLDVVPLSPGPKPERFSGRPISNTEVDMKLVKHWVKSCESWHGSSCVQPDKWTTVEHNVPFMRLIDLQQECIIETSQPESYVVLSYVRGKGELLQIHQENQEELKRPGKLSTAAGSLPRSFTDAMHLCRTLGYNFLWLDALCILQDNDGDLETQLRIVDLVYSKARLTVVAGGGEDANAGLPGISPTSRSISQVTAKYSPDLTLVVLQPDCDVAVRGCKWNTSGWAYQERVLSGRALIFVNNTVYFQCCKAVWGEDYRAEQPNLVQCAPMMDIVLSRSWQAPSCTTRVNHRLMTKQMPWFREFWRVVAEYTSRDITHPSDRLRGFEGIMNVFRKVFDLTLTYGIPEILMDGSLNWQPQTLLERVPEDPITKWPLAPSWSWAGWLGGVDYEPQDDFNGQKPTRLRWNRTRLIVGYVLCDPDTREVRELANHYAVEAVPEWSTRQWRDELVHVHMSDPDIYHAVRCPKPAPKHPGPPPRFYGLACQTLTRKFRLTMVNQGEPGRERPGLTRFGITFRQGCSHVPSEVQGLEAVTNVAGTDDLWLGSILLPSTFRNQLDAEHEFICLSKAYTFSSEELALAQNQTLEELSVLNVMLIKRLPTDYSGVPSDEEDLVQWSEACLVERVGVGRMLNAAWVLGEGGPSFKQFIIV